jgi:hypothetical protein
MTLQRTLMPHRRPGDDEIEGISSWGDGRPRSHHRAAIAEVLSDHPEQLSVATSPGLGAPVATLPAQALPA